jgi:hypothetical protein
MRRSIAGLVALFYTIVSANVLVLSAPAEVSAAGARTAADGANGHRLLVVGIDKNQDGRSDVEEYYSVDGVLVRRDSDRNFNGQVDLVEEFDAATHEEQRSIADIDDDGLADLLVLFQGGRAVFVEHAQPGASESASPIEPPVGTSSLHPLDDPFQGDTAMRGRDPLEPARATLGIVPSAALPRSRARLSVPVNAPVSPSRRSADCPQLIAVSALSLRGPPLPA